MPGPFNRLIARGTRYLAAFKSEVPQRQFLAPRPRANLPIAISISITVLAVIVVEVLYVWFISVGYWRDWPPTSFYYDMLAEAFQQGQSHLLIEPDPRLAELADPYSQNAREGIPFLTDASYFNGEYYMYWGPAPAAILAGLKLMGTGTVGDEVIVFVAANAVFLFSILILLHMWSRYSAHLRNWVLLPALLVMGTVHPILWIINRPAIQEAAIASGQAFLMAGLYFALPLFENAKVSLWRLFMAGSMWSLALSSRTVLAGAIGFFVAASVLFLVRLSRRPGVHRGIRPGLAGLLMPLIATGLLLGLYNYDRFGSPLELGYRYHLGGRGDYSQGLHVAFRPMFLIPNVYNYLARPVSTLTVFPFVKPIWGRDTLSPLPVELPEPYYAEQVTGALIAAPFLIYLAYLVRWLACSNQLPVGTGGERLADSAQSLAARGFRQVSSIILLGACAAAAPIGLFAIVAARYMLDAIPLFAIASIVGSWIALSGNLQPRSARQLRSMLYLATSSLSVVLGILLAVTGFEARFEHLNPILFDHITRFFAW